MGFLGLFGKSKKATVDKLAWDFKSLLKETYLEEISIGGLFLPTGKIVAVILSSFMTINLLRQK